MKTLIWLVAAGIVVVLGFVLYPSLNLLFSFYSNLSNSIPGYTPSTIDRILFESLPLIGLFIIFWLGWKVLNKRR